MSTGSVPISRLTNEAALRLVCIPYAGGGSAAYYRWRTAVPASADLVPLSLPGHDGRLAESPRTDLRALARELADDLMSVADRPYVLIGHSLGSWIAFELAREMRRRNRLLPTKLVVAAARPPDATLPQPPIHPLSDDQLVQAVGERYDGIPPAIVENRELLRLLLPVLRADIQMVETYRCASEPPLDVEILALGGREDRNISLADLAGWRRHTTLACTVRQFAGGHFFLFRDEKQQMPTNSTHQSRALREILKSL